MLTKTIYIASFRFRPHIIKARVTRETEQMYMVLEGSCEDIIGQQIGPWPKRVTKRSKRVSAFLALDGAVAFISNDIRASIQRHETEIARLEKIQAELGQLEDPDD